MEVPVPKEKWTGSIGEMELGASQEKGGSRRSLRLGGSKGLPFLSFEDPAKRTVALAGFVADSLEDVPSPVKEAFGEAVNDPVTWAVAWKEKGISRLTLTAHGVAAHASMPWNGDNAIMRMASLLDKLDPLLKVPEGSTDDLTLVVSTIRGGTRNNIVPDRCEAQLNARFPYPLTAKEVRERIMRNLEGESYVIIMQYELPAFETSPDTALIRELLDAGAEGIFAVPYATEAAVYSTVNPLVAVCGPGSPNMAHTKDEYVERWQLERAFRLYCDMGRRLQG